MRTVLELESAPALGTLYAKAAGVRARQVLPGAKAGAESVPDVEHRLGSVRVDPAQLVAYQRLMGDTVRDALPSVFIHGLLFPLAMSVMVREDFPLPLLGLVHLSNKVEHLVPVPASADLAASARATGLKGHRAGTQVDVVVEASLNGTVVWRGTSTYLARGVWQGARPADDPVDRAAFVPPMRTASWRLGAQTGRAYAHVMGDYNPIHLTALSAKALGMKRAIAHGMYLAGRALASAAPHDGGYAWDIEFATPVFLPSAVDVAFDVGPRVTTFTGWGSRSGKPHFHGSIRPLEDQAMKNPAAG